MNGILNLINLALGLSFVFLVVSMIVSQVTEIVSRWLRWRHKYLEQALPNLLGSALAKLVLDHPLVPKPEGRSPAYISPKNFAQAIVDLMNIKTGGTQVPTNDAMRALWEQAEGSVGTFKASVEAWFDDAMDRVGGIYKRRAQLMNFLGGLLIAVILNIDAFKLATVLYYDPTLASSFGDTVADLIGSTNSTDQGRPEDFVCFSDTALPAPSSDAADSTTTKPPATTAQHCIDVKAAQEKLFQFGLPIGWPQEVAAAEPKEAGKFWSQLLPAFWARPTMALGWLATAMAASLGAQFWFQTIGALIKMRSTGTTPKEKADQQAKQAVQ